MAIKKMNGKLKQKIGVLRRRFIHGEPWHYNRHYFDSLLERLFNTRKKRSKNKK
jgi:hypothetical protein